MPTLPGHHPPVLLELDLTEPLAAPEEDDPLARLRARGRRLLRPTLRALHEAAGDPHVVGLVAKVGGSWPWAAMQEVRIAVAAFAASGKPAAAWAEDFGDGSLNLASYVLATAFGEIWLQPGGGIGVLGVGLETTFLGGVWDRVGVEPQFEQRYEYKNAVDRLTRTEFTPEHRESLEALADSIFTEAVGTIALARDLDPDRVRELIDTGPRTAGEGAAVGLVDRLGYRDQVYAAIRERLPEDTALLFADRWQPRRRMRLPVPHRPHVALVEARGTIASGRSRRGVMGRQLGSDSVTAQLRAATEDDRAAAVVLRIDSPGGSAVASETIWREVCRVREAGKPVVVSMGQVAASGGYYIAAPADVIVALPATLTGSIGVFGGKFVVQALLDRVGLTTGVVERGARSLMFSPRRRFTEEERARLAALIDAVYVDFVAKVALGRGLEVSAIESVARGRVWSGRDAVAAGLVDELGGLRDAVRIARSRAELPDDAPVRPALRVPPLARLGRAKNSEDPRALAAAGLPGLGDLAASLGDLAASLGLPDHAVLQLPDLRLR